MVIFCLLLKVICAYILSFFISKKMTEQQSHLFLPKFSISSLIKTYFLRVRALVFIKFEDPFAAHDRNQWVVVSWERSAIIISYPCSGGVFSLRIVFTRFNPGYLIFSLDLIFPLCSLYDIMHYSCIVN